MISNELENLKKWLQANTLRADDPRLNFLTQGPNPRAVSVNGVLHHSQDSSYRAGLPIKPGSANAKNSWEQDYSSIIGAVRDIRKILGSIMKSVNSASLIFKRASRSPSEQTAALAKDILDEISQYTEIKKTLLLVQRMFENGGAYDDVNDRKAILHAIHYLQRADFTPDQVEKLKQVASNFTSRSNDFPDEVNQEGLDNLLQNSIYNSTSGSGKTLKVIREILQNAVDATDPKQHPQLNQREGFKPEIHLEIHSFREYVDLIVEDKGVGMDWSTLSKKFFVTFDSGKSTDTGAAGGFGIAKALIQDAPEHGWSVDTNGIHSSRFQKNVYMGTRKEDPYQTPSSEIRKTSDGTTLSLHGLPYVYEDDVEKLCSVYAINGRVKIFFEGKEIEPRFLMESDSIKQIQSAEEIPGLLSKTESEKEVVDKIFEKHKDDLKSKMEEIGLVSENQKTKYKFFLKKTDVTSGRLYVMINGQYQFDKDRLIPKMDLICSIDTTARPGSDDYPLDPGREYLRGPISKKIDELIDAIKTFAEAVGKNQLFKDGIESIMVNEEAEPMVVTDTESTATKKEKMMHALMGLTGSSGFSDSSKSPDKSGPENEPNQQSEPSPSGPSEPNNGQEPRPDGQEPRPDDQEPRPDDQEPRPDGQEPPWSRKKRNQEEEIERVAEELSKQAGPHSVFNKSAIVDMLKDAYGTKNKIEQNQKLKSIVEGLTTPGHILIQKNFLARKLIVENTESVSDILILWQKTLKLVIKRLGSLSRFSEALGKPFIPGIVFSNEVLGLWMKSKPEEGRKYDSISINPVTLAAAVHPKFFKEKIPNDGDESKFIDTLLEEKEEEESSKGSREADTPINRTSKFIFHLAIHEICHLLYPDYSGSSDNFHNNITKLELICHDVFEEVRREVRLHMPRLKKSTKKLISIVNKGKGTVKAENFQYWCGIRSKFKLVNLNENKRDVAKIKISTFKEFLIENENIF